MEKALGKTRTADSGSWIEWQFDRHKEEKARSMEHVSDSEKSPLEECKDIKNVKTRWSKPYMKVNNKWEVIRK